VYYNAGCYDGCLYTLQITTGTTYWCLTVSSEPVRSSPCVDMVTGLVWFGSHDHHVYAINIEVGTTVDCKKHSSILYMEINCTYSNRNLYVSVVFLFHLINIFVQHKQVIHKVQIDGGIVMSSPLIDENLRQLYIATLAGSVAAINCVSIELILPTPSVIHVLCVLLG